MKNQTPLNKSPEMPPWSVILTTLTLASVYAWLVLKMYWEPWKALCVVVLTAFGSIFALLVAIMIFENRKRAPNHGGWLGRRAGKTLNCYSGLFG